MPPSVSMIGLLPSELPLVRILVSLLRHPDASVAELTRHALLYLSQNAANPPRPPAAPVKTLKNPS